MISLALVEVLLFLSPAMVSAADWPTWRHDIARSGASTEELPAMLHLRWSRELPEPRVAWPNEPRLQFDAANEPVVMGKTLFVGSSCDGSLRAFDTRTGEVRWTIYTEGPIRCAPIAWDDNVYVASDDGYLYCLAAATGKQRWKVRGAPKNRPDFRHLGNNRLISYWPVRGGAVLRDGIIYFGAGIWPSMGVFIKAVDARSGTVRWTNHTANHLDQVRLDHNDMQEAGLSPQGYFLFAGGKLQVPNGRSMPAGFDLETGKLLQYIQGYRRGDARVTASGQYLFVGEAGIVRAADGREVGERWVAAGKDAPQRWSTPKLDLFEGPMFGYNFAPGCSFRSVFDRGVAYGVSKGFLYARDLNRARISLYAKEKGDVTYHPAKWDAPEIWKRLRIAAQPGAAAHCMIKAGQRLYIQVNQRLVVVDVARGNGSRPQVLEQHELGGTPASMVAADSQLFVSLTDGRLLCFGEAVPSVVIYPRAKKHVAERDDWASRQATRILGQSQVKEGYALVLGLDRAHLVDELVHRSQLHVIAVDSDRGRVNALRARLTEARLYGERVEAFVGDPLTFRFPRYLANLIIAPRPFTPQACSPAVAKHLYQTLRPYGGVLWVAGDMTDMPRFKETVAAAHLASAEITQQDEALLIRRAGPLPGSADWTHESASAARTYFSRDDLVRAPLGVLWYGDGPDYGFYKRKDYGRGVKPQVAGGRVFAFDDVRKLLGAVDAYTGRLLWTFATGVDHVRFASRLDAVYVARNQECDRLDPATGKITATYRCELPQAAGKPWEVVDIRVSDQVILVALSRDVPEGHSHPAVQAGLWDCATLVALDRASGKQLWVKTPKQRYNIHAIAMGRDLVFVTDSIAPHAAKQLDRRGMLPGSMPSVTCALEARTGRTKWTLQADYDVRNIARSWQSIRGNDDWISYAREKDIVLLGKNSRVVAVDARSGDVRWKGMAGSQPMIVRANSFINQAGNQYRITTGRLISKTPLFRRSGGCNYAVGNTHLMLIRNRSITYFDIARHKEFSLRGIRSGCSNSLIAADGLLNMPCFSYGCVCNYPLQTSFAMRYMPESADWAGTQPVPSRAR